MPDLSRADAEVEVLQSIYGSDCTFELLDSSFASQRVSLVFAGARNIRIELTFTSDYPKAPLKCTVQSSKLSKSQHVALIAAANEDIERCCVSSPDTEHAMQIVQTILDKADELGAQQVGLLGDRGASQTSPADATYKLVMVWFHHIMSPVKRSHIVDWASELGVCGTCKVGFPGALIATGPAHALITYITRLKGLQWQAMVVRHEDILERVTGEWLESCIVSCQDRAAMVLVDDMSSLSMLCRHVDQRAQSEQQTKGHSPMAASLEQALRHAIMRL